MKQLFISYSRKDTEFTRQMAGRFETDGLDAWVDWQDIPPSIDWMKEIQKGIEDADVFLYLVLNDLRVYQLVLDYRSRLYLVADSLPGKLF